MTKFSDFICKYRKIVIAIALLLMIPSIIGYKTTKINYDILSYLPSDIETVKGENLLRTEFGTGSYSVILLDKDLPNKNVQKMENEIKDISNVDQVLGTADITGTTIPTEMFPDEVKNKIEKNGYVPMLVTFKTSISDEKTFDAIDQIRGIVGENSKVSGTSALEYDTKKLSDAEVPTYVIIAVILCIVVLELALDSFVVPIILLLGIGIAILYNMGSNLFLGQISYITKAIAAVLQLGVTMDFSIFLYHSFQRMKKIYDNKAQAMARAIDETFVAIVGSSATTMAGFLALCAMELTLGKDIGIVMAKGVLIGVITVITILPAIILECDKLIEKTKTKELMPKFKKLNTFVVNHYKAILITFCILLIPAIYGNANVSVYYDIDRSLPDSLSSVQANTELRDSYNMVSTQIALVNKNMPTNQMKSMINKIKSLDGVEWVLAEDGLDSISIPSEILPSDLTKTFESDNYKMIVINSKYKIATDQENNLISQINDIIKSYDSNSIMAGEGPLTKDLVEIANHDFNSVNILSIAVILVIMFFVLKSASLPFILVGVIEFAVSLNMACAYFMGNTLPFVASIVIGTIQLGATVDYAILITTKYIENRKNGKNKHEAICDSLNDSVKSIVVSALCFFCATFGVSVVSQIDMIKAICTLISRGAIISMLSVMIILPACLILCDKLICKTTKGMKELKN